MKNKLVTVSAEVKLVVPEDWERLSSEERADYLKKHGLSKISHEIIKGIVIKK